MAKFIQFPFVIETDATQKLHDHESVAKSVEFLTVIEELQNDLASVRGHLLNVQTDLDSLNCG